MKLSEVGSPNKGQYYTASVFSTLLNYKLLNKPSSSYNLRRYEPHVPHQWYMIMKQNGVSKLFCKNLFVQMISILLQNDTFRDLEKINLSES